MLGLGVRRGTSIGAWFSGIVALVLTVIVFAVMTLLPESAIRSMFLERGPTQHASVFLGLWCGVILSLKRNKLRIQRLPLRSSVVPTEDSSFVLSSATVDLVTNRIHQIAEDPHRFLVLDRILLATANLKNLGRVSDVDDLLSAIGEQDESAVESSFSLLNGFLWAIPVLGFIGTVLGLSTSIARFSSLLEGQSDIDGLIGKLKEVTGGLSTAFETTLLSLVIALVVQLWLTAQKKAEEELLDDCSSYCLKQITNRIKILPYEEDRQV